MAITSHEPVNHMKKALARVLRLFLCALSVQLGFVPLGLAQSASNANNDLAAINHGDFIAMQWDDAEGAAQYWIYISTSLLGPWTLRAA